MGLARGAKAYSIWRVDPHDTLASDCLFNTITRSRSDGGAVAEPLVRHRASSDSRLRHSLTRYSRDTSEDFVRVRG